MSGAGDKNLPPGTSALPQPEVRDPRFAQLDRLIAQEQTAVPEPHSASGDLPGTLPPPAVAGSASAPAQRKKGHRGERADTPNAPRARERCPKQPKPRLPPKIYKKLAALTASFAQTLRGDPKLQSVIQGDLKKFRTGLQVLIRTEFRLRCGRPPDPLIDDACRMMDQGKSAAQALRVQRPGWDKTDPYLRYLAEKGLRAAKGRRGRKQDAREPGKKGGRGKRKPENLVPDSTQRFSDPGTE